MPRTSSRLLAAAVAALALLGAEPAAACTVSATGVAFGAYDPLSPAPDDSAGEIVVVCHPSDQGPVLALSAGLSGLLSSRTMLSGADSLGYNLYTDPTYTIVWGDGVGGSAIVTLSGGTVSDEAFGVAPWRMLRKMTVVLANEAFHGRLTPCRSAASGAKSPYGSTVGIYRAARQSALMGWTPPEREVLWKSANPQSARTKGAHPCPR